MRWVAALGFIAVLNGAAFCGEVFRDVNRQFKLTIPAGWVQLTPEELEDINEAGAEMVPTEKADFPFAGFRLRDRDFGDGPYILIQEKKEATAGVSYEQLERELKSMEGKQFLADKANVAKELRDLSAKQVSLDRGRNRFSFRSVLSSDDSGTVLGLCTGHIGSQRVIRVIACIDETDLNEHEAAVQAFNDSFQFDPGAEFQPAPDRPTVQTPPWLSGSNRVIFRYGVMAGIIFLIYSFTRRRVVRY